MKPSKINKKNKRFCQVWEIEVCEGSLALAHNMKFWIIELHCPNANPPFSFNLVQDQLHCFPVVENERYEPVSSRCLDTCLLNNDLFKTLEASARAQKDIHEYDNEIKDLLEFFKKLQKST